jgi:hypothetical protein
MGVNFHPPMDPDKNTWPCVFSITKDSLADRHPGLLPGLILHAVEGVKGRRIVEQLSFEDGMQVVMEALPSKTGQPITLTFQRGLLFGQLESRGREFYDAQRQRRAAAHNERAQKHKAVVSEARQRAAFSQGQFSAPVYIRVR